MRLLSWTFHWRRHNWSIRYKQQPLFVKQCRKKPIDALEIRYQIMSTHRKFDHESNEENMHREQYFQRTHKILPLRVPITKQSMHSIKPMTQTISSRYSKKCFGIKAIHNIEETISFKSDLAKHEILDRLVRLGSRFHGSLLRSQRTTNESSQPT